MARVEVSRGLKELVGWLLACVSKVVVNRLNRSGNAIAGSLPVSLDHRHSLSALGLIEGAVGVILNRVDQWVLYIGPILSNRLVVALVSGVTGLERSMSKWLSLGYHFL